MPEPKVVPATALLDWTRCDSDRDASVLIGIAATQGSRWRRDDLMLTARRAEELCDRLGIHPSEVWPDWYDHITIEDE